MVEDRVRTGNRVSAISIAANILLAAVKLSAGLLANSSAMISDSVHSLSDSVSTVIVLIGLRIADVPADPEHPYGHGRAETVAAKLVALLLVFTALGLGYSSLSILLRGTAVSPGSLALVAAVFSIAVKESMYRYVMAQGLRIESNAMQADAWHHRTDALSSVTALLGVLGAMVGFPFLDPAAALVVAAMILKTGVAIYWRSVDELVDRSPSDDILRGIRWEAEQTPGVVHVNEVKARSHGPYVYVDLKICVDPFITVQAGHDIAHETAESLRALPRVKDVLVHVNPCSHQDHQQDDA